MIIEDGLRRCVAFLGAGTGAEDVAGTCFWVGREAERVAGMMSYLVTAKHVIDDIAQRGSHIVWVRHNTLDGKAHWVETKASDWVPHNDSTVDVAIYRENLASPGILDLAAYPLAYSATAEGLSRNLATIGIGEDVFILGLFTSHYGRERNIPIARSGMIAAMLEEKVPAKIGGRTQLIDAYLLETRSIGGLSGSPVFVYIGHDQRGGGFNMSRPKVLLLGVMQGHYDDLPGDDAVATMADKNERRINKGIGIAIPIEKVIETIAQVRDQDDAEEQRLLEARGATAD